MVLESLNELVGSGLPQRRPKCLCRFDRSSGEFATRLLNFDEPRGVCLVAFGAYSFNCPLVGGAPVSVWDGAALPILEVIDEGSQGAPLRALLVGDLRSMPPKRVALAEV